MHIKHTLCPWIGEGLLAPSLVASEWGISVALFQAHRRHVKVMRDRGALWFPGRGTAVELPSPQVSGWLPWQELQHGTGPTISP